MPAADLPRVTIVGGGFSGASVAIQLARHAAWSLDITVVEPRPEVGYGLAYSTDDPDHRLNGTAGTHLVDPGDPEELTRWCAAERIDRDDPEAVTDAGALFIRRRDFGRFVADAFAREARRDAGVRVRHLRDEAIDATPVTRSVAVTTKSGARLSSDLLVIATGNAPSRFPAHIAPELAQHAGFIADPADLERIRCVEKGARVLVLGTGLTALDVVTTLLRGGHRGHITAVSSRALRPRSHRPAFDVPPPLPGAGMLQRIDAEVPMFVRTLPQPRSASALMRALRREIAQAHARGESWYAPFDALRDPLWQVWSALDVAEKKRLLRHARRWYDVHRFRAPPPNEAIVHAAERQGRVTFRAAKVRSIGPGEHGALAVELHDRESREIRIEAFDAVVSCAGLDDAAGTARNPLLASLTRAGWLVLDPTGVGFAVDPQCRPFDTSARASALLRVVGPPTAGVFGDPLGAMFIAAQIRRMLPGVFAAIGR